MITEQLDFSKEKKIKLSPCNSNRASELGHECLRYLVYNRTHWDKKTLHNIGLQYIFDMGNEIESIVLKELNEAGFSLQQQQRDFQDQEHKITGHIDSVIIINDKRYLLEIKSCSPYVFETISDPESIKNHRYPYIRKYYAQINLYMYLSGISEEGILLFKNKSTGRYKDILIQLDYKLCENLLKKAEQIEKHLKDKTLPERIEFNEQLCGDCPFQYICLPSPSSEEIKFIINTELEELLEEYDQLKNSATRFKKVDDLLKIKLKGQDKISIGDFYITGKWRKCTKYNIPSAIKNKYEESYQYWVKNISKFDTKKEE